MLRYQVEVFEAALQGNTIAVLDTGSGKTMVAVMLAREHVRRVRAGEAPRRIVLFLAPTVHLVHQQFEVIREYTDLDATECYGASGVAEWTTEQWKEEVGSKEIAVMTPQILLDALRHAFVTMSAVSLLIFDECHRACGNHPYTRVMKVVKIYNESIKTLGDSEDCLFSKASFNLHESYFKEALYLIEEVLPQGYDELMKSEAGSARLSKRGYISSKVDALINIFKSFGSSNEVICLIFVDRIMTAKSVERSPNVSSSNSPMQEKHTYHVDSTGATITADCCVNLIRKYCEKLPKDRYYMPKPSFEVSVEDGSYQCTLTLPPNAAFPRIVGPLCSTCNLAKQLVSLEACKKLHQLGELNDHLVVPIIEEPMDNDIALTYGKFISGPGTTKRKELHGTTNILALSGSWVHESENVMLNTYRFDFVCDQEGRIYSVLDLIYDTTAEDSFEEMYNGKASPFSSFVEYYHEKYGIIIQHPNQPLLLLKQSHNPHNLLFSKLKYIDGSTGDPLLMEKGQIHARVPPELLIHIDVTIEILKSFYLLPSVMHRLQSLMLASQLRRDIGYTQHIPNHLILEAITTLRCCETFSLERLELLGDSGYVRDSAFDPRRWVAPGQISLRPFPCNCGIETAFVPTNGRYITNDPSFVVGKPCDRGHRWMCSKTISDCVEALVGAYYVGGGIVAALWVMRWFGIEIKCDRKLVQEVKLNASYICYLPKIRDIEELEAKLKYNFSVKGLLLEAITHPSLQESGVDYCYQRLEFLGDSVLDLLITRYLYVTHTDVDPGELTDLRSALVLGDIMESIAGAIFVDSDFNVDLVWKIVEPLLSPMITPDNLALPPYRELLELCSHLGYFINSKCSSKGEEKQGLSIKQCLSKAKQLDVISSDLQSHLTSLESPLDYSDMNDYSSLGGLSSLKEAVVLTLKMDKGGPRSALFKLCKRLQWPMPEFEFVEQRFRTPIVLDGVTTMNFNSFVSTITLHVPDVTAITLEGERRTDKKASQDSASLIMLHKLQELKVCICKT
ncbi:hypothetical protein ACQ4PT_043361 [Festuca glaucescens]